jgi:DNA-binding response OmpR family regulator
LLFGKTILIVEDRALIAVDIETALDELGASSIVTAGGGESFSPTAAALSRFDLAIVDIHSRSASGSDLASNLDGYGVPVIFLTTDPGSNGIPVFAGRHAVVQKPFTYEDLRAAIAGLVA